MVKLEHRRLDGVCRVRTFAFVLMVGAWLVLGWVLARTAVILPMPDMGLNPGIRIELRPGTQAYFLAGLLAAVVFSYIYGLVLWIERRLAQLRDLVPKTNGHDIIHQPRPVRRLKAAIRAGNVDAVRRHALASALDFEDQRLLTPYELAELYGNPEVIAAVGAAFRQCFGKVPPSRFTAYTDSRNPYLRIR